MRTWFTSSVTRAPHRSTLLALLIMLTTAVLMLPAPSLRAQSGNILQNGNFETGALSPWFKWPPGNPGIVAVESCCANQTPGGTWDAFIQPQGQYIELAQVVPVSAFVSPGRVTPGRRYSLSAEVSTKGMLAHLQWFSNVTSDSECGATNVRWPTVVTLQCQFTLPAGTTQFNVHLGGIASAGIWSVSDDWFLVDITDLP